MGTRSVLDRNLTAVRDDILRLGSLVKQATERAVSAYQNNNAGLAHIIILDDKKVDSLHQQLENEITTTTALQQPTTTDLRVLIASLLISNELERMGDHAEGIAKTVVRNEGSSFSDIPPIISEMQSKVGVMIDEVMEAYLEMSIKKAEAIALYDEDLDKLYQRLFNKMVKKMHKGNLPVEQGTYVLWIGHNLERIGDRVTNICERIIYAQTGEEADLNP
jgi:phosphate transport system protein